MVWWEAAARFVPGLDDWLRQLYGQQSQPAPVASIEADPRVMDPLYQAVVRDQGEQVYFPVRYLTISELRRMGGTGTGSFANVFANRVADIDPHTLYGLYHTAPVAGEGQASPEQAIASWYDTFVRTSVNPSLGQRIGFQPAQSPNQMHALLAANLNPGSQTYFNDLLRDAIVMNNPLRQFRLVREAVLASSLNVASPTSMAGELYVLQKLYDDYVVAALDGRIPSDMSYIEYLGMFAGEYLKQAFPWVQWDQLDEWAAQVRASVVNEQAQVNQGSATYKTQTQAQAQEAPPAQQEPLVPPPDDRLMGGPR